MGSGGGGICGFWAGVELSCGMASSYSGVVQRTNGAHSAFHQASQLAVTVNSYSGQSLTVMAGSVA
jgi:hypothetical protein